MIAYYGARVLAACLALAFIATVTYRKRRSGRPRHQGVAVFLAWDC